MKLKKKYLLILPLALTVLFSVLYFMNPPRKTVPETVEYNKDLPSVVLNDYQFHSEVFGAEHKETVIILHGGPGDDYSSLLSLKALADEYRVVFFDQRGTGLSKRVEADEISLHHYIEDLNSFVDHYSENGKVSLIGHSWGAMYASYYIGRYPHKVKKAVLADPGYLTPEMAEIFMEKTNGFMPEEITGDFLSHVFISWIESLHMEEKDSHESRDYFRAALAYESDPSFNPISGYFKDGDMSKGAVSYRRLGALASSTLLKEAMDEEGNFIISFTEGVENFPGEVLFLTGEYNTLTGEEHQKKHMEYFPKARLEIVKNAGHTMFGEQPEISMKIVREYLKE